MWSSSRTLVPDVDKRSGCFSSYAAPSTNPLTPPHLRWIHIASDNLLRNMICETEAASSSGRFKVTRCFFCAFPKQRRDRLMRSPHHLKMWVSVPLISSCEQEYDFHEIWFSCCAVGGHRTSYIQ